MNNIEDFLPQKRTTKLEFFVNGKKVTEPQPDPEWTLLWYLRKKLHLTGTKYGCGEGGCGACTVMISQYIQDEDRIKHYSVNACLMPLCAIQGMAITTVEGIGSTQDKLHPVQERIAKAHGSQCGFCTPGIVMSMYTLLRTKNKIDFNDIDTALQGNLCRCTGYRPIIEGYKTFIEEWEYHYDKQSGVGEKSKSPCMMGKDCCRVNNRENEENEPTLFKISEFTPYSPSQEPIFPPELKINNNDYFSSLAYFRGPNMTWLRPVTLEELLLLKKEYPSSKLVAGNTEVGVEVKFKKMVYPILISPTLIKEISFIRLTDEGIDIGAATTLSDVMTFFTDLVKDNNYKGKSFEALKDMLHWFAGTQIRNTASLVGNIITASPISDLNPILMACSASLIVKSLDRGERKLIIDTNFFKGYRKVALCDDEVVLSVQIPFTTNDQYIKAYKQAKRREDDISIVTAAFNVEFEKDSLIVADAKLCFGGMAPTTVCATRTSNLMKGKNWDQLLLKLVFDSLTGEFQLDSSVPGGMPEYRKSLCLSLFFRFYLYVLQIRSINGTKPSNYELSGSNQIPALHPKSSQCFEIKNNTTNEYVGVGKPIVHMSALKQATGEAIYCDDLPTMEEELYLALLFSKESHARIKSIDASQALEMPGVVAFFSAKDIPKGFRMGPIVKDEEVFVEDIVTSRSCVVGAIVAESEQIARKARDAVLVSYERIEPVIVTIEDAIEHESYFPRTNRQLVHGKVDEAFKKSNHIKDGYIRTGAQEHFYLETVSAFALRKEEELEIICSSQNPAEVALTVSQVLNIPNHKIISKAKRLGGGFGGKETRPLILIVPVAFAAYRLKKPVRGVLDRDEDIQGSGYRHPCLIKYKVGFDETGKINGVVFDVYANGGNYLDISSSMLERVMTHLDNCCKIPNIEINLKLCKTNTPSNTAFRGFGAPQAMFATENLLRDIATALNKSYEDIINVNMYHEGDFTYYDQELIHCTISRCWSECIEGSNYWQRKKEVEEFNRLNRWKKKGITLIPTKYGISFQIDLLMQGGALILVYTDGSVLLTIGGVEMGQGLFTKMIQVASSVLEIEVSKIHISEMSTDKVPNSSPTAASVSSDLYGMAVLNACTTIKERLAPIKASNPNGTWEDWVATAYVERVSLSATGFYAAPKIEFNAATNSGRLFEYYTFGVACSEVIIDCLTGDHQVLRTDIVMDIGESLNPAIDIGQIEGGFMQGYGLFTMEEMLYSPSGEILSRGPGAYKIPGFSDIPKEFNVSLLKGAPNPRAVYSSKAVGEPPLFLAASVYFAIKEAIKAARRDAGVDPNFVLDAPATCARIRMACEDHITKQVKPTIKNVGRPWNVTP